MLDAVVAAARRSADRARTSRAAGRRRARSWPRGRRADGAGFRRVARRARHAHHRRVQAPLAVEGRAARRLRSGAIARGYEAAGAAAISVLTEPTFFDGSLDHLRRRPRGRRRCPLLRKDFIVTPYQIARGGARRRRRGAAHRRGARRRGDCATCRPSRGRLRTGDARGSARRGRTRPGGRVRRRRDWRQQPQPADAAASTDVLDDARPADSSRRGRRGRERTEDASTTCARCRGAGYDAFLIGERFMTAADPGAALGELRSRPPRRRRHERAPAREDLRHHAARRMPSSPSRWAPTRSGSSSGRRSPRAVDAAAVARAITRRLPPFVTRVGVFVDASPHEVAARRAAARAGCGAAAR